MYLAYTFVTAGLLSVTKKVSVEWTFAIALFTLALRLEMPKLLGMVWCGVV